MDSRSRSARAPPWLAAAGAGPCTDPSSAPGPRWEGGRHRPALSWLKPGSAQPTGGAVLCLGQASPAGVQSRVSVGTRLAELVGSRRAEPGLAAGLMGSMCPVLPCLSLDHLVGVRVWARHSTDTCGWAGRSPYSAPASAGGGGGWAQPEQGVPADTKSWGREQQDGNGCRQAGSPCCRQHVLFPAPGAAGPWVPMGGQELSGAEGSGAQCQQALGGVGSLSQPLWRGRLPRAVLRAVSLQDAGGLRAPGGGGRHDDHGEEAGLQVRLHLCAVPLQPPASPRVAHAAERVLEPALPTAPPPPALRAAGGQGSCLPLERPGEPQDRRWG